MAHETPQNNTRRRKRRRRASSHAQGSQGNRENQENKEDKAQGKQGNTRGQNQDQKNNSRRRRRGGSKNQRSNQRGNRGNQRNNRGNKHRKPSHRNAPYASQNMETRDETSAGGLVVSGMAEAVAPDGSVDMSQIYVALIGRLDRRGRLLWSMPKGHVEPNEHQWDTARREVWEETGIEGEPFAELGVIDYWFVSDGVRIHKTVHHNLLRYVDGVLNDEDPEVTEVAWVPVSELIEHLAYADERKLARIAFDKMPELARAEKKAGRTTPR
ncbi:ADP-ribose pyrophosphatase YjhB, NUDIX family [Corynebacterium appendicis CIP 107643]|uniref:ADP-ribose pyrophosphatase YjhB, NUDIX family n=1 Tax=Corynebacterium appendicis CIP 107643 TaxID=1161099 RepID=A0A1N7IQM0_9CORY|nr:NUDIX hydrolase [Corynebacterium appendicis]WJY62112.1 Putative mutator protein MutT4 [Corynebacterium appendicis CIP 107643]SIS39357.1 ADP-ribose pyrophosphatase YjhB, NUDIX family [Corynebacterium appendicis CIP 107643]